MKKNIAVAREHRDFFRKNGWVEFDAFLSEKDFSTLKDEVDQALCSRLNVKNENLPHVATEQRFKHGRDLWRTHAALRKTVLSLQLAAVAAELLEQKILRYGYDLLIPGQKGRENPHLLPDKVTLADISAIQGIIGGVFICLDGEAEHPFASKPGHAVVFKGDLVLEFSKAAKSNTLLIVYTQANSVYVWREKDPMGAFLKQYGLNFGDRLGDLTHPIVAGRI